MPNFFRTAVVACACAVALLCAPAVFAQSSNDDRYGFLPVPPLTIPPGAMPQVQPVNPQPNYAQAPPIAAPSMPVQQAPMMPAQAYGQPAYVPPAYAQAPSYPPPGYGQAAPQPSYAPPPAYPQAPAQQPPAYAQAPSYAPPPQMPLAQNIGPPQPYGYVQLPVAQQNYGPYYTSNAGDNVNSGYVLGPGDKVRVAVFGEDDLSGEYEIDGSGMVRLPLIGTIRAGGYTAPALGISIAGALAQGYLKNPRVNVAITTYRPFYIIGAVNRPGNYPYVSNMTALDAVALGGGFTDKARESTIYVRHEGSTHEDPLPASQVTRIFPGDVVRVKTTVFWDAMDAISPVAGPAAIAAAAF